MEQPRRKRQAKYPKTRGFLTINLLGLDKDLCADVPAVSRLRGCGIQSQDRLSTAGELLGDFIEAGWAEVVESSAGAVVHGVNDSVIEAGVLGEARIQLAALFNWDLRTTLDALMVEIDCIAISKQQRKRVGGGVQLQLRRVEVYW